MDGRARWQNLAQLRGEWGPSLAEAADGVKRRPIGMGRADRHTPITAGQHGRFCAGAARWIFQPPEDRRVPLGFRARIGAGTAQ
jgi:hypothetical protein